MPAAVRHSRIAGTGTFALIPADSDFTVLSVEDTYRPDAQWMPLRTEHFTEAVEGLVGPGSFLAEAPLPASDDYDAPTTESEAEKPGQIDAIAWITKETPDTISAPGANFGMAFDSAAVGTRPPPRSSGAASRSWPVGRMRG